MTDPLLLLLLLTLPAAAYIGWPAKGPNRRREIASLGLRLAILTFLVLALAGLELKKWADEISVVFLVDVSDSVSQEAIDAAVGYIEQAFDELPSHAQAAVIAFGADALVERGMSTISFDGPLASVPVTNQTNLSGAIHLALALFPTDSARRIVIFSDGINTSGDPLGAARLAAASGTQILVRPMTRQDSPEAMITDLDVPANLHTGERFDLRFSVFASHAMQAVVRVTAGGTVIHEGTYNLKAGEHAYSVPLIAGEPGFADYQVQVDVPQDGFYQNNEIAAFSMISGPPTILVVAPQVGEKTGFGKEVRQDEAAQFLAAMDAAQILYDRVTPVGMPADLASLSEYSSVVLVNVPARQLNQHQMEAVQSYVRDLGGGLVVIGGPSSYGVGGYFQTPLEETLPVEMQLKDDIRRASLTLVFVIDHSGSMTDTSGGRSKLELAKEAAIRSVALLAPFDKVGVVVFDSSASWVVPITEVVDEAAIIAAIEGIQSGGGTDILAGLQAAASKLPQDDSAVKHIILLTDGGASPTGIPQLVEQLNAQEGITVSTVGIGSDAAPFLPEIAKKGGGRYHLAIDPASIPSIFAEETSLVSRAYMIEETFFPKLANSSPILSGIKSVPPLHGYVATTAKAASRTILVSEKADPILVSWRYGLGRSVAFTSDATGHWARNWVSWDGFVAFWSQVVSFVNKLPSQSLVDVQVRHQQGPAHLQVEMLNESGGYLNGYQLQANVVSPTGSLQTIELRQSAPGQYQADFIPAEQGVYMLALSGQASGESDPPASIETVGWVLSYSPEYRITQPNPQLLSDIAAPTGGGLLPEKPSEVFSLTIPAPKGSRPIWPWLLAAAAVLLPVDIAVRRLVLSRRDFQRAWAKLAARLRPETSG
ncbi:MAG: VWA domain-containing protein, partial [Anaerolineae bacterium]|nr:VWA domain-containing protein [Anaerolineae bacterium]